jgi:hypothetical protein
MKKLVARFSIVLLLVIAAYAGHAQKDIYEIRVYNLRTDAQITSTDSYLQDALIPSLHRLGIRNIGVFKPISNDTAITRKIYVVIPYPSIDAWKKTKMGVEADPVYLAAAKEFTDADTLHAPYVRMESILLSAFPDQLKLIPTPLKSNPDAVYELRSYESPTEHLHHLKVKMFNDGGEIKLFKKLDFQAIFYADVLVGSRMPNLMYMIAFSSLSARDDHWKSFGSSSEWKKLSTDPAYQNNISVSHIDSIIMRRTPYSDL